VDLRVGLMVELLAGPMVVGDLTGGRDLGNFPAGKGKTFVKSCQCGVICPGSPYSSEICSYLDGGGGRRREGEGGKREVCLLSYFVIYA